MKKLLLILSAVFVSVSIRSALLDPNTGWDYLNPYAYDLKSEVINNGQTLRLTYKFNAPGFNNSDDYNLLNPKTGGTGRGIQIYLLYKNEQGEWQRVQKDDGTGDFGIYTGGFSEAKAYTVEVPIADLPKNCKGKELTWEARVHGNIGRTKPKVVKASGTKPTNAYGIAINNDPMHARFAQMFVSEAYPNKRGGWDKHGSGDVYANANTMLEYSPLLTYVCAHHKHYHDGNNSHFASSWKNGTVYSYDNSYNNEPNRVKISDDGRMFVSSFHPHASCAVVEYGRNRDAYDAYKYYSVIQNKWGDNDNLTNNDNNNPFLYRRCIGMDVKGSGDNLKIILLWIDANGVSYKYGNTTQYKAKFEIWEYEVGRAEKAGYLNSNRLYLSPFDTSNGYVHKIGEYADWDYENSAGGAFYQGVVYSWNNHYRGFADLAYGPNNDVWVKLDYAQQETVKAKIIRVKLDNGAATKKTVEVQRTSGYYGGSAIYVNDNMLFTGTADNAIHVYEISSTTGELETDNNGALKPKWKITDSKIGKWVTGFASDYAGNIFVTTEGNNWTSGQIYAANVLGIAMPYSTAVITRAKGTFTIYDAVPNILATDLRYDIVRGKNQYEFSFYVNTKPQEAEIRFYESKAAMKSSLDVVNADNYKDGTNQYKPAFVYKIPQNKLKQGKITVNLGAVGGLVDANGVITNERIPAGVLYWSVYVRTRDNKNAYAPVYQENVALNFNTSGTQMRKHIVVNNYPETDMFGSIIAANYQNNNPEERGLLIYRIKDKGIDDFTSPPTSNNIKNERYELSSTSYINKNTEDDSFLNYPRRMAIAPTGRIYIADEGATGLPDNVLFHCKEAILAHSNGGVKFWDPSTPNKFTLFSYNTINTSTGVALWKHDPSDDNSWKLYATNTYSEFTTHSDGVAGNDSKSYYTKANQAGKYGWNGFVEYLISSHPNGSSTWQNSESIQRSLGMGDASGNFSIVAMDKGIWMCQHREHTVALKDEIKQPLADNVEAICISFIPYNSNTRTWRSSWINGSYENAEQVKNRSKFSQTTSAPVQSTPGGGMAYKKIKISDTQYKEYIYVPNHDGHIAQVEITGWTGSGTSIKPTMDTVNVRLIATPTDLKGEHVVTGTNNKWRTSCITSMDFDFAGNLVVTVGPGNHNSSHALMVYTMPYDRTNAREIQAPNSCIEIPERVAQLDMDKDDMDAVIAANVQKYPQGCAVDLYRPLQGKMFNTICLPFELDINKLPENHPLKGSRVREYTGVTVQNISGENILVLEFSEVSVLEANKPYIIQIKDDNGYNSIIRFQGPIQLTNTSGIAVPKDYTIDNIKYTITYKGIVPYQEVAALPDPETGEYLRLILVADNRLAVLTGDGNMYGFRGYFELSQPLPKGMKARISTDKKTPTNTTIVVDGKKVNIDKYLREGRVYIRVGDSLYTVDGQLVK